MSNSRAATILVTGATGNVGAQLAGFLATQGIPFRAMVCSVAVARRLPALANAELVAGDFSDPETVAKALSGIDKAFLLGSSSAQAEAQQLGFVDVAKWIGTKHIVKLSQWVADIESPVHFLRYHAVVEQRIRDSGLVYTFLRPNLFMQGLLGFSQMIAKQGQFFASIGDARISAVDVRDIAAVATTVLSEDVVRAALNGMETGQQEVLADDISVQAKETWRNSPAKYTPQGRKHTMVHAAAMKTGQDLRPLSSYSC